MLVCAVMLVLVAQPAPEPVPREAVFEALSRAYRDAPTGERVAVAVRESGRTRSDSMTVFVKPDAGRVASLRVEVGGYTIWTGGGELVAVHEDEADAAMVVPIEGRIDADALAEHLPPLVLPQIGAATGRLGRGELPPIEPIRWSDAHATREIAVVTGETASGAVELGVHAATGRIRSLTAPLPMPDASIELRCRPIEPGDPTDWEIDTSNRVTVSTLRELMRGPTPIGVADRFDLPLRKSGEAWRASDEFAGSAAPELLAVLLTTPGADGDRIDVSLASLRDLERELTRPAGDALPAEVQRLRVLRARIGEDARDGLSCVSARWSIGRLTDDGSCVVLVGPGERVLRVVGINEEIESAVREELAVDSAPLPD